VTPPESPDDSNDRRDMRSGASAVERPPRRFTRPPKATNAPFVGRKPLLVIEGLAGGNDARQGHTGSKGTRAATTRGRKLPDSKMSRRNRLWSVDAISGAVGCPFGTTRE